MSNETVLTPEQIDHLWYTRVGVPTAKVPLTLNDKLEFARAIEQAVLQSPEVQRLREDAERYRFLRRHTAPLRLAESLGIPRKQVKRSDDPAARVDEMCDAAMEKQP